MRARARVLPPRPTARRLLPATRQAARHVCHYSTQPARPAPYPGVLSVEDRLDIMDLCHRCGVAGVVRQWAREGPRWAASVCGKPIAVPPRPPRHRPLTPLRFDAAINSGQQHALGQFFADDAEVHHPRGVVAGADALLDYFRACEPLARGNRHLTCNVVVEPSPDGAAGRARAFAYRLLHRAANPPVLLASGTIEDELVKSAKDGRWRFVRRRFVMDPPAATGGAAAAPAPAPAPAPGAQQRAEHQQ